MATDVLLDKISKFAEAKKTEHDNKVNNELALCEEYENKIKTLADRIADLVQIGNAMKKASYIKVQTPSCTSYSNVLKDFEESMKNSNISMKFMCGVKRENRADTEEDKETMRTIVGVGFVDTNKLNDDFHFFAYPDGYVERLEEHYNCNHGRYYTTARYNPVNSKLLLRFLTEFDEFEKTVKDYITNLEV